MADNTEFDFKNAYEKEKLKSADLAQRIADLEDKNQELEFKLNRIKNNPIWKASTPARNTMHFVIRQKDRLKNAGSVRGVIAKLKYKQIEKKAKVHYGTESFPDEERIKKEREEEFPKMPLISILVPLYNTPENFLRDMIESVLDQTYVNWQLCLADGSDADHSYVETIAKEYQQDPRNKLGRAEGTGILYHRLEKNTGISGNTNECLKLATGEYIGLLDHDDILHPEALYYYVKAINEKNADYI